MKSKDLPGSQMTLIYWKSKKFWVGKLLEHPEIMTQGRTLQDLEMNIRDPFQMMALADVPEGYRVKGVLV
ncbi:MAG: type II toxin-antitoxin system HicB family antitoxin [Verrucomicrobia bacterium]|nr:type II toxin-antitoxin system HicB family antitoxin [Verrucomicrobiota bacterium]